MPMMNEQLFDRIQEQTLAGSGSLPDSNTAEAILYGKAYSWIKSALWVWDEMEDYLIRKADQLDGQLIDREWSYRVMRYNRYLIYARSPPVNEVSHLKDLFTLHDLVKCIAGIRKIEEYRRQNLAWARMQGIQQYVDSLAGRGISEAEWKAATASYNTEPITYDYVHGLAPDMMPGEVIDWNEAMRDLMGEKEYDRLMERIYGLDASDPREEPESEKEEPITDGLEEDEPSEDPFFDGFFDDLEQMFSDPIAGFQSMSEQEDDELSHAADYWEDMDVDNRGIIDILIHFAEAMA